MSSDITQLASAYIDGETTDAESAWVESSSEAMRHVRELRELRSLISYVKPADETTKEQHIGAALAAFDQSDGEIVSLRHSAEELDAAAIDTTVRPFGALPSKNTQAPKRRPRWLAPVASAAAIVTVAGLGYTLFPDQDSLNTSRKAVTPEMATVADTSEEIETEFDIETDSRVEDSDEAGGIATDSRLEDSDEAESEAQPLIFDEIPTERELQSIAADVSLITDFQTSLCAHTTAEADGRTLLGFLPVSIDDIPGEMIVFESANNDLSATLVTATCASY